MITGKFPTKEENPEGLHARYKVTKTNGESVDDDAEYFVLRLDWGGDDKRHIAACRNAILEYAEGIKDHIPKLAQDLIDRYS